MCSFIGGKAVNTETRDLLLFAVALFGTGASLYYYVAGVLDNDRLLSRVSLVAFVLFGVLAAAMLLRVFL